MNLERLLDNSITSEIADELFQPYAIALDGADVIVTINGSLVSIDSSGVLTTLAAIEPGSPSDVLVFPSEYIVVENATGSLLSISRDGNSTVLATNLGDLVGAAVKENDFIVVDFDLGLPNPNTGRLLTVSRDGTVSTIAEEGLGGPTEVVVEGDNFWVTDFTLGRLLLVSSEGNVTEIATDLGQPLDIEFDGRSFLITDFADGFNTPGNGRILHVTQSGEVETFVSDIGNPSGIAIQGSDLLFTDVVAGTVNRIEGLLETDLVQTANDIFSIEGVFGRTELQFSLEVNDREPTFVNEIGVFVVDDDQGIVNGIAPNQDGYLEEALREAEIIFSGVSDDLLTGVTTSQLPFSAGDNLVFYLVQNGTTDAFLSGDSAPNVLLTLNSENINGGENFQVSENNGTFALAFENELNENESEFDDLVVTFRAVDDTVLNDKELIFGTSGDDQLEAGVTSDFDGVRDLVFTGAGEDLVDLITTASGTRIYSGSDEDELFAGTDDRLFGGDDNDILDASEGQGGNRLYGGAGDDELFAGTDDRLFGGDGDDILDASVGDGGNRLYGGDGNDLFFLGREDRLVGGEGGDRFFASAGGGNTITGGSGVDEFWIVNGELPDSANIITDFEPGMDTIGIGGIVASSLEDLIFTQDGSATVISFSGSDLAIFSETEVNTLANNANFVFV